TINDFTAGGYAVFTFDYRHYGESAGQPRHLLNVKRQLADWRSALTHVRQEPRIDRKRLVLWGSSLGGGHALSIAAQDHEVAAVAAQVPHCNAKASIKNMQTKTILRVTAHAFLDAVLALFGGVHTIPMLGEPGELGAMTFPGWKTEGLRLLPTGSKWVNALPARSMLSVTRYNPDKTVHQITCPVCIHYGRKDRGVPPLSVEEAARRIPDVEMHPFDGGHFDVYHGQLRREIART
ncbi:MAG: alpha/beta hydrolase, partial [Deltaproteobacteria bacterium]